jgi:hypothetical protein
MLSESERVLTRKAGEISQYGRRMDELCGIMNSLIENDAAEPTADAQTPDEPKCHKSG